MRKARFICIAIIMMVCNFAVIKERILIFYGT